MKKHALLLGNGVNDVTNSYKWSNLVKDVAKYLNISNLSIVKDKPFSLLYEEMFLRNLRGRRYSEDNLKSFIAKTMMGINPNELHAVIRSLDFSDILTTNYDYAMEKCIADTSMNWEDKGIVKQSHYNLFRRNELNGCKIWHMHGEINKPNTILLGYEHYSGQLQHMRNYVVSGTGSAYQKRFPPLIKLLKNGKAENNSWLDMFFTRDIHVVGLTLDFVELDLWWLLTYRARTILEKRLPIGNQIIYYYPKSLENQIQFKLDMLRANEVIPKALGDKPDMAYYEAVFDTIKKNAS